MVAAICDNTAAEKLAGCMSQASTDEESLREKNMH